ncbi:MAG: hypothetical protein ACLUUO_02335 [Sellimonas intestinalis]
MKIGQYDKAAVSFENGSQMDGAGDQLKREMAYNEIFVLEKAGDYTKAKERQTPIFRRGRMMKM